MSSPSLASFTVSSRIGSPSASLTMRRSPSFAAQDRFLACLEPDQALVFGADRADHLAGHFALRVGAAAVGQLADPFQLQPFDPPPSVRG